MKTLLKSIVVALAAAYLVLSFTGCVTAPTGPPVAGDTDHISKLAPALRSATSGAIIYACMKSQKAPSYLPTIKAAISEFGNGVDLSSKALRAKINALPFPELKTLEAQLIITPVLSAYEAYGEQYVRVGIPLSEGFKTLLKAISAGIEDGEVAVKAATQP